MSIISQLSRVALLGRNRELDRVISNPIETQHKLFKELMGYLASSVYGSERGVTSDEKYNSFTSKLDIASYEDLEPYIKMVMAGEESVLTKDKIGWYAKSSGTTSGVSKFIPTSDQTIKRCHYRGIKDVLAIYQRLYPGGGVIDGKTLTLGGTLTPNTLGGGGLIGDLSGIMIQNQPSYFSTKRVPERSKALIADFDQKIEHIIKVCSKQNVTNFAGVPVWYGVLFNKMLEYTQKSNMCEIWPNIDFFAHGGVNFTPYREQFKKFFPSDQMKYMETYNASEGFFAIADDPTKDDMLLMVDYSIYYEFLDINHLDDSSKAIPLEDVKCGVNYALIISSLSGLWRYMIGDTVVFTSTLPYRIKISGRTKHFINMAGEEVIIDNAERAFERACSECGASMSEYTGAPLFKGAPEVGCHQWVIEFSTPPTSISQFSEIFDKTLQTLNSDYAAKRSNSIALTLPEMVSVPKGTFYSWMRERGKFGGQNKVPRLANKRDYVDPLINFSK